MVAMHAFVQCHTIIAYFAVSVSSFCSAHNNNYSDTYNENVIVSRGIVVQEFTDLLRM